MTDVYDALAPVLVSRGYFPLPIGPGTKAPHRYVPSMGGYQLFATWSERPEPLTTPQPGAGIGVRTGKGVIALDYDDEEAALRVSEVLPCDINKSGQRGWTSFFRTDFPVPSENFYNDKGELVLQVLSEGKQTVLPPSVHPDTKQPYRWTNGTLYDTPASSLPLLPRDYRERILALGYCEGGREAKTEAGGGETFDTPHGELNDLALKNIPAWINDLGLYGLKRKPGRANWVTVPTWRPSSTHGNEHEKRDPNLKISPLGIMDHGVDKGYSALDLVMVARSCSLSEAFEWLSERVKPERGPDVDYEALLNVDAPGVQPEEKEKEGEPPKYRFKITPFWEIRPGAELSSYLVDEFLPAKGIALLWGPPKCLKSFFMLSVAFHVAKGWEFSGRAVQKGTVIYCAFEGAHGYTKRIEALRRYYELEDDDRTPIYVLRTSAD
jgi:AAA domain/Bifunctional DNA primase/polymerase, N-terminal